MPNFHPLTETDDPQPPTAYEQYVRARLEEESSKRLQQLRKAAASFPTFVLLQYRLAEALDDAGLQEEALRALARLHPARFILTTEAYLLEGGLHFRRDDPEAALQAVKTALDIQDSAEGRLLHAEILLALGLEDEARTELERSRELGIPAEEYEALSSKMTADGSGPQP
jgi:tetratricopeptide (TPR) repeat protein